VSGKNIIDAFLLIIKSYESKKIDIEVGVLCGDVFVRVRRLKG
jgi:hypothetical protein